MRSGSGDFRDRRLQPLGHLSARGNPCVEHWRFAASPEGGIRKPADGIPYPVTGTAAGVASLTRLMVWVITVLPLRALVAMVQAPAPSRSSQR